MDKLETVAQALIKVETIDGDQFERLYTGQIDADGIDREINEKEKKIREINLKEAAESEKIRKEEEERFYNGDTIDENIVIEGGMIPPRPHDPEEPVQPEPEETDGPVSVRPEPEPEDNGSGEDEDTEK